MSHITHIYNMQYTPSCERTVRELFNEICPGWNVRPEWLEPTDVARDRLNGWGQQGAEHGYAD